MRRKGYKLGQSTMEYLVALTAIIAAIIAASSTLRSKVQTGLETAAGGMANAIQKSGINR